MARKAKKKAKARKTKKRAVKRAAPRAKPAKKKSANRKSARKTSAAPAPAASERPAMKSQRRQQEPIPSDPAGRIGLRRPSNEPTAPGLNEPHELAKAEPDARFGDRREPEASAREQAGNSNPPSDERAKYRNTDEGG